MHLSDLQRLASDIQAIKNASGTNAKRDLAAGWTSPQHKELLDLIGHPDRQWYTTWNSVESASPIDDGIEWSDMWYEAEKRIASPTVTAGRIKHLLVSDYPAIVLKAIVDKTPDCGLSVKEIQKALGEMKPFAIGLAADWCKMKQDKREKLVKSGKYASTPKMDGLRCLAVLIPGRYEMLSRAMKPLKNLNKHLEALKEMFKDYPCCVDGEIMGDDWNETVTAVKNSKGGHIKARFYPFDLVPAEEYLSGKFEMRKVERLRILNKYMRYGEMFVKVPFVPVMSLADVDVELRKHLQEKFEGSVLHDLTAVYRPRPDKADNRTEAYVKVKLWQSSEFRVVGFMAGTGKHHGRLGALIVEGECEGRTIKSEVGTGLTDALRHEIWDNQEAWRGAVVEVKWFELTKDSLRFPSFLRRRTDLE